MNVYLHCIISNLKRISKISPLTPPGKISADAHGGSQPAARTVEPGLKIRDLSAAPDT